MKLTLKIGSLGPRTAAGRQRGVSLIEGVLYLVISMAVVTGGLTFFDQAQTMLQTNTTTQALNMLHKEIFSEERRTNTIKDIYWRHEADQSRPERFDYGDYMLKSGRVPGTMADNDAGEIVTPWGGRVTYSMAAIEESNGRIQPVLRTVIRNLPASACIKLFSRNAEMESPIGAYDSVSFVYGGPDLTDRELEDGQGQVQYTTFATGPVVPEDIAAPCKTQNHVITLSTS